MRKITWMFSIAVTLLAIGTFVMLTHAQDLEGSISGTVYRDINANGVCADEGEPPVAANIPLELVNDDNGELFRITAAADGTYFYSTDTFGLWRVTIVPGQGWRITSQQTLEVVLTEDNPDAFAVDFCIIEIEQATDDDEATLPESGAPLAPVLIIAAAFGFILTAAGAVILLFGRLRKT